MRRYLFAIGVFVHLLRYSYDVLVTAALLTPLRRSIISTVRVLLYLLSINRHMLIQSLSHDVIRV